MKIELSWLLVLVNNLILSNSILLKPLPEDGRLNFTELGIKYGHNVEEYEVTTEDGYILTLFHIPGRRKTPVLIMHGVADSADTFIVRGKQSLAISLADAGYDVWAGNTRGNKYSRRHLKLNPDKDEKFWDFSFHEGGYYDLPAIIDRILETTGETELQTIGHSQGTTIHFVLLSTRPEYNEKIKIFIAMAPVVFLGNYDPPISTIAKHGPVLNEVFKSAGTHELFYEKAPITALVRAMCGQDVFSYELCFVAVGFRAVGFDKKRFEPGFHKVAIGHYPGGTSRKSFVHFGQLIVSKRFCQYDYGDAENLKRYGFIVPTGYNLRAISAKVAILVGRNDPLSRIKDVEILRTIMANIVHYQIMKPKVWNHIDFIWGNDMSQTLFPDIFKLLTEYD